MSVDGRQSRYHTQNAQNSSLQIVTPLILKWLESEMDPQDERAQRGDDTAQYQLLCFGERINLNDQSTYNQCTITIDLIIAFNDQSLSKSTYRAYQQQYDPSRHHYTFIIPALLTVRSHQCWIFVQSSFWIFP